MFLATCIASAVGTLVMAFAANKPFAMAPGMGLNSFFAVVAGNVAAMLNTDYTSAFQAVLCIILVEGNQLEPDSLAKAREEGLAVLNTRKTAYEVCGLMMGAGIAPANE